MTPNPGSPVQAGQYDHARCPTCGVPWADHDAACPRHPYRHLSGCVGHGRGGAFRCCEFAGIPAGLMPFVCAAECPCHDRRADADGGTAR